MIICELCGSANVETEPECRVCGHSLVTENTSAPAPIIGTQTPQSQRVPEPAVPADIGVIPTHLQMSAFGQDVSTGAPPMYGGGARQDVVEQADSDRSEVPTFMQAGHRTPPPPVEHVELISANDLPDWIKQIAAADAEKAQADEEAQQAANLADVPASIIRRQLPGETVVAGPSTNWLSKSSNGAESTVHWGSAEVASANWGTSETSNAQPVENNYPTAIPATAFVPTAREQPRLAEKGRFSRSMPFSGTGSELPIYRRPVIQLLTALIILAVLALVFV